VHPLLHRVGHYMEYVPYVRWLALPVLQHTETAQDAHAVLTSTAPRHTLQVVLIILLFCIYLFNFFFFLNLIVCVKKRKLNKVCT
jgi:hypothetical protein